MTPRNPRGPKIAAMRARTELLKSQRAQPVRRSRGALQRRSEPLPPPEYIKPTYLGTRGITIGGSMWGVGEYARVAYIGKVGSSAAWVFSGTGLHLLQEKDGKVLEAVVPPEVVALAVAKYFPVKRPGQ